MKVVIKTNIIKGIGETEGSFKARRLKDVSNSYTLKTNEVFSTDIFDVKDLHHLHFEQVDYKRYRSGLKVYGEVSDTDWDNYSDSWKRLICKEKATTMSRIKAFVNNDIEVNRLMMEFDKKSVKSRRKRFGLAKAAILNNVDDITAFSIQNDIQTFGLEKNYIDHGMEGVESLDPVLGMYDFLNSTNIAGNDIKGNPWNSFSTIGVSTRSLTFRSDSNYTQSSLLVVLNDYLKHGKKIVE